MVELTKRKLNNQRMVCKNCFFIYTPEDGDQESNVTPYTDFRDIDPNWVCPICDGSKEHFVEYHPEQINKHL